MLLQPYEEQFGSKQGSRGELRRVHALLHRHFPPDLITKVLNAQSFA